jgi:hypothetical protein
MRRYRTVFTKYVHILLLVLRSVQSLVNFSSFLGYRVVEVYDYCPYFLI